MGLDLPDCVLVAGFLRNDQYAVALGLVEDGQVVLGVLGCPNLPVDMDNVSTVATCCHPLLRHFCGHWTFLVTACHLLSFIVIYCHCLQFTVPSRRRGLEAVALWPSGVKAASSLRWIKATPCRL